MTVDAIGVVSPSEAIRDNIVNAAIEMRTFLFQDLSQSPIIARRHAIGPTYPHATYAGKLENETRGRNGLPCNRKSPRLGPIMHDSMSNQFALYRNTSESNSPSALREEASHSPIGKIIGIENTTPRNKLLKSQTIDTNSSDFALTPIIAFHSEAEAAIKMLGTKTSGLPEAINISRDKLDAKQYLNRSFSESLDTTLERVKKRIGNHAAPATKL